MKTEKTLEQINETQYQNPREFARDAVNLILGVDESQLCEIAAAADIAASRGDGWPAEGFDLMEYALDYLSTIPLHKSRAFEQLEDALTEVDVEAYTLETLDECCEPYQIGIYTFRAGQVLKEMDPVAFRETELEQADFQVKDGVWVESPSEKLYITEEVENWLDRENDCLLTDRIIRRYVLKTI
jgi:hypothetical protein